MCKVEVQDYQYCPEEHGTVEFIPCGWNCEPCYYSEELLPRGTYCPECTEELQGPEPYGHEWMVKRPLLGQQHHLRQLEYDNEVNDMTELPVRLAERNEDDNDAEEDDDDDDDDEKEEQTEVEEQQEQPEEEEEEEGEGEAVDMPIQQEFRQQIDETRHIALEQPPLQLRWVTNETPDEKAERRRQHKREASRQWRQNPVNRARHRDWKREWTARKRAEREGRSC